MSAWEAIEGNCLPLMHEMEPRSFDAVITDPPYNVGKDSGRDHSDRLSADEYRAWLQEVMCACARVSRGPVVFFPGLVNAPDAAEILKGTGASRSPAARLAQARVRKRQMERRSRDVLGADRVGERRADPVL